MMMNQFRMKCVFLFSLAQIFFLIVIVSSLFGQKKFYRLHPLWVRSYNTVSPLDINLDGMDELIIQHTDNQVDIIDQELNYYSRSFNISGQYRYALWPIPGTAKDSLSFLACYGNQDSVVYKILPPTSLMIGKNIDEKYLQDFVVFHRQPNTPKEIFHQSMGPLALIKDSEGKNLVLFSFNTSWDANGVRGLLAADLQTRQVVWQYLIGPGLSNFIIKDLDANGGDEIVISTYASNNGVKGTNSVDDSSYIFVLGRDGNLKWQRAIGPYWTGAWAGVGDFFGDGIQNIVVYQYSVRKFFPNQDQILILDARTGQIIHSKRIGNQFTSSNWLPSIRLSHDFSHDGRDEIVVGNTDGFVRLLNGNLSELRVSINYDKRISILAVEDLDGDGLDEIVCLIPNERIIVLNDQLQPLCSWDLPNMRIDTVVPVHDKKKRHLLIKFIASNETIQQQLVEFETAFFPFPSSAMAKGITPWLVLVLLTTITAFVIQNLFYGKKARNLFSHLLTQVNLSDQTLLINRNGRIEQVGANWCSLLSLPSDAITKKSWQEVFANRRLLPFKKALEGMFQNQALEYSFLFSPDHTKSQIPIRLKYLYFSFIRMHCLLIFDLTEKEHIRQVKHWAQVAQQLAHGIKNPLTTVKLNAEQLQHTLKEKYHIQEQDVDEYFQAMLNQVTKLKKMSDGFMHFVEFEQPSLKPIDLNREIQELIPQWQPEDSAGIQIDWELEATLPLALIDTDQFAFALKNVFFNALESMESGGRILISTQTVQLFSQEAGVFPQSTYVEVQIRDTGCGIPAELLDKVTLPYFTRNKPEGTGLGLSIVKKIMDSHNGQLDIQSEVNVGTTVTLRFGTADQSLASS